MNNFLVRWRAANRTPRFDKSTGQPRKRGLLRDTRGIAAVVALALVVGSGLAVVSVSSAAEAHTPSIKVTCEGVTVTGLYYEASGSGEGQQNLIKFQLQGGEQQVVPFSKNATQYFAFPNSTQAHTFTASVTAWNNPTHTSWNRTWTKTSTPCVSQSIIDVTAPRCDVPGGSTDITATFKDLVAERSYEVTLAGGAGGTKTATYTPKQTTGSYTWAGTAAGPTYTVTITDKTNRDLTASKTVQSVACPELSGIAIVPTECTVPGESAAIKVNVSDLVIGREYRIDVVNAGSDAIVDSHTFIANATTGAYNSAATPSASYYVTVVDTSESNATPLKSSVHAFLPCPEAITKPTVTATQCDVVSTDAQGEVTVAVEGLVPGRTYNIVVTDGAKNAVFTNSGFVATTDRFDVELSELAEGTYTVTVTDALVPSYTASTSATIVPCATNDTTIELAAEQCTVPGGAAAITATVSNFAVGRDYTVTLMLNNVAVGAAQKLDSSTGDAQKFTFAGLEPANTYRVIVTDTKSSPTVTAAADTYLAACPGNPVVMVTQAECNVLGASTISISAKDLVVGQTYTVTVVTKSTGDAVAGVAPITFEADKPTRTLDVTNVPNGETYTVSIVNADKTLSAEGDITLEVCDLPTFPLPPEEPPATIELPTLAFTGSSTIAPTLAGLGFLQLGLVLVGFSIARRRSVVRKG
ncbi:RTX toxins and related Ca2+-binding protein [marine actinobacterium PHSC20C1]|nr:RTX toxins and related Ca2+-binding protein [marine actinobacterium PHSC20C1]